MHTSDRLLANALARALKNAIQKNRVRRFDIRAEHHRGKRSYSEVVITGDWGTSRVLGDGIDYELRIAVRDGTLSFSMSPENAGELSFYSRSMKSLDLRDPASLEAFGEFLANPLPHFLAHGAAKRLPGERFGLDLPADWWAAERQGKQGRRQRPTSSDLSPL